MTIYQQLVQCERDNNRIRVGVVGVGQMGFGMISQLATVPGMAVTAIIDRNLYKAQRAHDAYLASAQKDHAILVSANYRDALASSDVDVIVDATGVPESGAKICLEALIARKHVILLNVEVDITIGTLMYNLFKSAGLVYSGSDGDEPAATFELFEIAKAMGLDVLAAGKGKNNKLRLEANPTTVAEEAKSKNMAAHMLASFADGTKTMAEMTLLSNATGFKADVTGMHGTVGHLKETVEQLRLKSEGGVLNSYGVVEYVDGLAPGVFVIVKGQNSAVCEQLNYMMRTDRDHHILYRPFHLGSLETPLSIAKAVLTGQASIIPLAGPVSDTVCVAKKDIKAGERLDGIGGYCVRGVIESHQVCKANKLIPIGLIAGNVVANRDIPNGTFLTEDDVQLDTNTTVWKLRKLQDEIYG